MLKILDTLDNSLVDAEIILAEKKEMPLKKDGWKFNWRDKVKEEKTKTYILRVKNNPKDIEGVLHLKTENKMLIMDLVELAARNIGKDKKYDFVAGCLIAYACRESFKIEGPYQGFLTFKSKTALIKWYTKKYHAEIAGYQNMYISPSNGIKLIDKYLGY